jgi:hypothetical protein
MIKGAPKDNGEERGFINHHGDMTEEELLDAVKKKREKKRNLKK